MILYSDVATLAMIAGMEYCTSNAPTGRVPSVIGDVLLLCDEFSIPRFTNIMQIYAKMFISWISFTKFAVTKTNLYNEQQ